MKAYIKVTLTLISIACCIVLSACTIGNQFSPDGVINYLESKYGELTPRNNVSATARQKEHSKRDVFVVAELEKGEVVYSDNYLAIKYEEQLVDLINKTIKKSFNDYKLVYIPLQGLTLDEEFNADMNFETYIKRGDNQIRFDIILPANTEISYSETEITNLKRDFIESTLHCDVDVYVATTDEIYKSIEGYSDYYDKKSCFESQFTFAVNEKSKEEMRKEKEKEEAAEMMTNTEASETTTIEEST